MKVNLLITCILTATMLGPVACKKENNQPAKDYTSLFKNTVWTGEFHYASKPSEPVSIEFKEGGQFTWYEWSGEFPGTWKIENDKLTVSFPSGSGFTSTITTDDKMSNIQNLPANGYLLDNAVLNKDADVSLENTVWTGANLLVRFKPGNLVDLEIGPTVKYTNLSYVRKAKSVRFNALASYKWFTVSSTAINMKGVNRFLPDVTVYPFQLTKQ